MAGFIALMASALVGAAIVAFFSLQDRWATRGL
jgi:hypothetical protein